MNRKSNILAALTFAVSFISAFLKELKKRGVVEEMIFNAMKSDGDLIPKMAEAAAEVVAGAKVILKDFFKKDGPVKFWFSDNFRNWILSQEFGYVGRKGALEKHDLPRAMTDEEILKEFNVRPYASIADALSEIYDLVSVQPNGQGGDLLTNGHANLFYVRLKNGDAVVLYVRWRSGAREWCLRASRTVENGWSAGDRVFSRS